MNAETNARVIVIFGDAGGIGSELVRCLARDGCRMVLGGRAPEKIDRLGIELGATPDPGDASVSEEVDDCVAKAIESHGNVDGVVNCAGSILLKPSHLTSDSEWLSLLNPNSEAESRGAKGARPSGRFNVPFARGSRTHQTLRTVKRRERRAPALRPRWRGLFTSEFGLNVNLNSASYVIRAASKAMRSTG